MGKVQRQKLTTVHICARLLLPAGSDAKDAIRKSVDMKTAELMSAVKNLTLDFHFANLFRTSEMVEDILAWYEQLLQHFRNLKLLNPCNATISMTDDPSVIRARSNLNEADRTLLVQNFEKDLENVFILQQFQQDRAKMRERIAIKS